MMSLRERLSKHALWTVVLRLLLLLLLIGCTNRPSTGENGQNILRVAAFPIAHTDPAYISSDSEVLVANHVYDYLIDIDANNTIQPRLATDWRISEDGRQYSFRLAEGITFHDGSPMTADDVVWTFERLRDTEGLPTADLYTDIIGIESTGDLELTFTLDKPNPFFLYDLSDNHALILKKGSENPKNFNGTGPFIVESYQPEERITLKANEKYFVEGQPKLEGLEIIFFSDQAAAVDALRGGQIDLTMDLSTSLYESLNGREGLTTIDITTNQFAAIRLRTDRPPGNDPRVIQALKMATDRQAIFDLVQRGYGAVGQDTPVGPLFEQYYTEQYALPPYDPEAARQLLADVGYPDGLVLEIQLPDTLNFPDLAVVLKDQWSKAGINIDIIVLPESVYYGEENWLSADLGITGWGHRPYPQFYLEVMLVCGAKWNETRYCNPDFDRLAALAGSSLDESQHVEAYYEIQRLLIERGPIIVPYFFAEYAAIDSNIQGFELKAFSGRTNLGLVQFQAD